MLKALYDYAVLHELIIPEGYVKKTIKAYISLDSEGNFIDIFPGDEKEEIPCPDIGSLANGKDKCNVLIEKRSIVVPETSDISEKSQFFIDALIHGTSLVPEFGICVKALQNPQTLEKIRKCLDENKIKLADRISFRVSGKPIFELENVEKWWNSYRTQFKKKNSENMSICLITGNEIAPVETTTPINGLKNVGGHARGDALICFDKPAFCSYGLKKAYNAPVSENAFAAVKSALDELLKKAPVEAGIKFVHWYDYDISEQEDLIEQALNPQEQKGDLDDEFDIGDDETEEISENEKESIERAYNQKADELLQALRSGENPGKIDCNYYILMLSGVSGRVMIRRYERGNYQKLQESIRQWNKDLELIHPNGKKMLLNCQLARRFISILKYQKDDKKVWERVDKEIPGISSVLIMAIINNTPLPDSIAIRALANIRSQLLASSNENERKKNKINTRLFQWLKVWLLRKNREHYGGMIMSKYNMEIDEAAYHCGGLLVVYEWIQKKAMNDVNTGVIQRYYASAIHTPALVLGQLSKLANYHLEKIEHNGYLKKYLENIYCAIGNSIPKTLDLEKQALFALGYYQMSAQMREDSERAKKEREKKEKTEEGREE